MYTLELDYPEQLGILKKIRLSIEIFESFEFLLDCKKYPYQAIIDYFKESNSDIKIYIICFVLLKSMMKYLNKNNTRYVQFICI
jgi:hypothetical protein